MLLARVYFQLRCMLKIILYKLYFRNRFKIGIASHFRKDFGLYIAPKACITVGHHTSFNRGCAISALGNIMIGNYVMVGENVKIYDHNHNFNKHGESARSKLFKYQGYSVGTVVIEDNVWIGSNVTILKNVRIGKNSVIGANCLIHKSIPENSLVKSNHTCMIEPLYNTNKPVHIAAEG